jgi:MFS superfamily sulfate permease-like transporter
LILKKDNLKLGILMGILAPFLAMLVYYFWNFSRSLSISEYFFLLRTNKQLLTAISSISLLANAVIFTFYINTHRDQTAKGIFVATLLYGIFVLLYKLIS